VKDKVRETGREAGTKGGEKENTLNDLSEPKRRGNEI